VNSRRRSDVADSYERPIRATYFFFRTPSSAGVPDLNGAQEWVA
jgi:hypothetical protein